MNYNANIGARPPGPIRKAKRVSDINAMGGPAVPQSSFMATPFEPPLATPQTYTNPTIDPNYANSSAQYPFDPNQQQQYAGFSNMNQISQPQLQSPFQPNVPMPQNQFAMFQQPIVQDMAMQYGQKLADQGKQLVESQIERYIPVTKLKYYFAVDNKYVINKLRLLLFPFTHKDWSLKYDQENPVQPRYDLNAPDLYIPTMAYITYVVLAGLVLGMQNRFTPEQLGILASSALAYSIFEMIIYSITLYITNIPTSLKTLDLLAYSGYKFAIIVICILVSIVFQRFGYYITFVYCSLSLGVFLLRTLKIKFQQEKSSDVNYDAYGAPLQQQQPQYSYTVGKKRKLYFMFLVAGIQPVIAFLLSVHLLQ